MNRLHKRTYSDGSIGRYLHIWEDGRIIATIKISNKQMNELKKAGIEYVETKSSSLIATQIKNN